MRYLLLLLGSLLVSGAASAGSFPGGNGLIAFERQTTSGSVVVGLEHHPERQLTFGTADVFLPAWSPDGARIAYATTGGLYVLPAQGGTPTSVPTGGTRVYGGSSWSPDGSRLAFVASNGQVVVT